MTRGIEILERLVRLHRDGATLPAHVKIGGAGVPLDQWLHALARDQREAPMAIASLIEHPLERPTIADIAGTLIARLGLSTAAIDPIALEREQLAQRAAERRADLLAKAQAERDSSVQSRTARRS